MLVIDRLLVATLRFVMDKLIAAAEAELDDDDALRERLLDAQMRLELGELGAEEFEVIEAEVLARLREIKEQRLAASGETLRPADADVVGVEAMVLEGHGDGQGNR